MGVSVFPDPAVHHFSLSVPDIERSAAWYRRILGFDVESRFAIAAIPAQGAFLVRGRLRIELWQLPGNEVPAVRKEPHSDLQTGGMKHIAFRVHQLAEKLEQLLDLGVDIAATQQHPARPMVPFKRGDHDFAGGVFAAFIRDPDGVLIELLDEDGLNSMHVA